MKMFDFFCSSLDWIVPLQFFFGHRLFIRRVIVFIIVIAATVIFWVTVISHGFADTIIIIENLKTQRKWTNLNKIIHSTVPKFCFFWSFNMWINTKAHANIRDLLNMTRLKNSQETTLYIHIYFRILFTVKEFTECIPDLEVWKSGIYNVHIQVSIRCRIWHE